MARDIRPLAELPRRMPEQGRIRIGKQVPTSNGKSRPAKISTFRFTSSDRSAIEQLAEAYGGEVVPFDSDQHPNQWEVETLASELPIVLPPGCLSGPTYELWSKGGLQRRCDGVVAQVPVQRGDDDDLDLTPCICKLDGSEDCKVKLRLNVLLPTIRFAGGWLLTTGSWNAAQELPGMVDMIQATQRNGGLPLGILRLEERKRVRNGRTKVFIVPVLGVSASLDQIVAGGNQLGSAGTERAALGAANPDDEAAEGVIEWDPEPIVGLAEQVVVRWNAEHPVDQCTAIKLLGIMAAQIAGVQSTAFTALDAGQADQVADFLEKILSGDVDFSIVNGRVKVKRA